MKRPAQQNPSDLTPRAPSIGDDWEATPTDRMAFGVGAYGSLVDEMRRLYVEGDTSAALDLASSVHPASTEFSPVAVPKVIMSERELRALPLDHKAGFVLARCDGATDVDGVLDVAAMPAAEAAAILEQLIVLGAIRLLPPEVLDDPATPAGFSVATPSPM